MHPPTIALEYQLPESLYQRLQADLEAHSPLSIDELLTQALIQHLNTLSV